MTSSALRQSTIINITRKTICSLITHYKCKTTPGKKRKNKIGMHNTRVSVTTETDVLFMFNNHFSQLIRHIAF